MKWTCNFCQEGLLWQISVESMDFLPQKAFRYLTYPLKRNTVQKECLVSLVKPCEGHQQLPCCSFPGAALSLLQTSTMPACSPQAACKLSQETELSISSMYHIQQATAISHQSWLAGSAEQARVCRILSEHTLSLQNHHPKHYASSRGRYVGHVALLGPAKSLQQSLLYLWLLSIKKIKNKKSDCFEGLFKV